MEVLGNVSLWIHIAAGIITLIAGPIALFYNKNNEKHKLVGKIFFYAMVIVVITSVTGFIKRPTVVFFQFLLGISFLVSYHIIRGIRGIRFMKGNLTPSSFDRNWAWMALTQSPPQGSSLTLNRWQMTSQHRNKNTRLSGEVQPVAAILRQIDLMCSSVPKRCVGGWHHPLS